MTRYCRAYVGARASATRNKKVGRRQWKTGAVERDLAASGGLNGPPRASRIRDVN